MKTVTFPKPKDPTILSEGDALVGLFDYINEKIRDYHLVGNICSQKIGRINESVEDMNSEFNSGQFLKELEEKLNDYNYDIDIWSYREKLSRKNERNLFKIKRMIQKAFANGELEK